MKQFLLIVSLLLGLSSGAQAFSCGHERIDFAKDQIVSFISQHPMAADTVEGVHLWWIDWGGFAESIQITQAALDCLQVHGVMETVRVGNNNLWRKARD